MLPSSHGVPVRYTLLLLVTLILVIVGIGSNICLVLPTSDVCSMVRETDYDSAARRTAIGWSMNSNPEFDKDAAFATRSSTRQPGRPHMPSSRVREEARKSVDTSSSDSEARQDVHIALVSDDRIHNVTLKSSSRRRYSVGNLSSVNSRRARSTTEGDGLAVEPTKKHEERPRLVFNVTRPARICAVNPYVARPLTPAEITDIARGTERWRAFASDARRHHSLVLGRMWGYALRPSIGCPGAALVRFGGNARRGGDGGKYLCNLGSLTQGCIIYSLGSNGDFSFERSMVRATPCDVHTFDCTVGPSRVPKRLDSRIHFHRICLGDVENARDEEGRRFSTLPALTKQLGHARIDLLKVCRRMQPRL